MKKKSPIRIFLRNLIKLIDRKIVVPITKLILKFTDAFGGSSKKLETWLSNQNTLLFISLGLAVGIFILIDQKIIIYSENSAEVLKSRPVTAIYNEEAYVIEGLPETVDVTLIGSQTDLFIANQIPSYNITVDLTGLKPGTHEVNIKYNDALTNIDYKVNPSVATVIIYPKVSESRSLTVDLVNKDKLDDKLAIDDVKIESDQVIIKGAEYQLEKVASVKALVDIEDLVSQKVGTNTIEKVDLVAYDAAGQVVDVEIVPGTISADVVISSPSKEVKVKLVPKGSLAFGYAISSYSLSVDKVTLYGPTSVLENINSIPLEIDVNDLKANKEYKLELTKPVGVTSLSTNTVKVNLTVGEQSSSTVENVKITLKNLPSGYTAQAVSSKDAAVNVNVKGYSSIIKNITPDSITASVNLDGLTAGTHEVEVKVEGSEPFVEYLSMTKKITIKIIKQ